ncbi:hypothetical protein HPT25_11800 [Bacillus sp. BRMEA1]|uniref:hypothetical protein n=1 Tax=Neobacillus endophyticus TaxID=2738405 RepID=UPI0015639C3A|nr:hypothetical protein [Neobacillus endophyticus]NRD78070.1 hypothetical protein [Neobacillus endophyticus]
MRKKMIAFISGALLLFGLAGCGTSQSNNQSQNTASSKSSHDHSSMKGMDMGDQSLTKAFQDELKGFTTIEQDIKKGDYKSATTVATNLHDEFHAAILPPLKDKKGETYAENIHGKYDSLQDAIVSKDHSKIAEMIKVNRDNLISVAKILGVSVQ